MDTRPSSAADQTARLALLALRASIDPTLAIRADAVIVEPETDAISTNDAVARLAALPKPLICTASTRAGLLVISTASLSEAKPLDRSAYEFKYAHRQREGGFFDRQARRLAVSDYHIAVRSRDEYLVVSLSVANEWERDYYIARVGMKLDDVETSHNSERSEYREARRLGAKGILEFISAADGNTPDIILTSFDDPMFERQRRKLAGELPSLAKRILESIRNARSVAREEIPAFASSVPEQLFAWFHLSAVAEQVRQQSTSEPMPPEVKEFLDWFESDG